MLPLLRRTATLLLTATLLVTLVGCQPAQQGPHSSTTAPVLPKAETTVNPMAFTVIKQVPTAQIRGILPQSLRQPIVLVFKSKYCHDCQRMAPELAKAASLHKGVHTMLLDVQYDKATHGAILSAFQPAVIPVVVTIQRGGVLRNVMVGYHPFDAINDLYKQIAVTP